MVLGFGADKQLKPPINVSPFCDSLTRDLLQASMLRAANSSKD